MNSSPGPVKIKMFRDIFRGREDVFSGRWENNKSGRAGYAPVCRNEWISGVCGKPQIKCGECVNQAFIPVTNDVIRHRLTGRALGDSKDFTVGVYPLLQDDTCWFLAADFDKKTWMDDVKAFRDSARNRGIPVALERSRSGQGGHVWIFFAEPVPARDARRWGH